MARQIELTVPDIGGFADVPVVEVLVVPGETIVKDAPLVTLESDKATMEVPASEGGKVADVRVRIGDKVSQGSPLVTLEVSDSPVAAASNPVPAGGNSARSAAAPRDATPSDAAPRGATPSDAAPHELLVPDIGGFADVPVVEVLVAPGQTIAAEEPLVTLESEKATMEVPAERGGLIKEVRVKVGDRVSQGSVLATLEPAEAPVRQAAAETAAHSNGQHDSAQPAALLSAQHVEPRPIASSVPPAPPPPSGAIAHASPAIRRFARELGVDLPRVRGSGPNGRVTREDVQGFVKGALSAGGPAGGTPSAPGLGGLGLAPWPSLDFAKFGPVERVPLSRIKKISGPNLLRNWVMIPHVTQHDEADVTALEAFRKEINAERKDTKVTMLAFVIKASIAALQQYPDFNASLDGDALVRKHYFHIGFAADTPGGLVVPVVRDADTKGVLELAREMSALAAKARDGKLGIADMTGGSFTISSLGGIGGTSFTPIINAPEVAILGLSRSALKPVWDGTEFVPRLMLPLSLSYDHRVIDGAAAARFTTFLGATLADLRRTLL